MLKQNRGLIKAILLIIVALLLLSYFRVNLRDFLNPSRLPETFSSIWQFLKMVWRDFLASPIIFVLEKLLALLTRIR